jgi:hypothetical protein
MNAALLKSPAHFLCRAALAASSVLAALGMVSCQTTTGGAHADADSASAIVAGSPPVLPSELASAANLLQNNLAKQYPGSFVVHGLAQSSQASFSPDTQYVVLPPKWAELDAGQVVIFRNSSGGLVAGQLIRLAQDTWVTNGDAANNRVTRDNLVGEVVATFFPPGADFSPVDGVPEVAVKR